MAQDNRPLSPHLSVYRWQVSNSLSILHRATGVMLSLGAAVLTAWLVGLAAGPDSYLGIMGALRSPVGLLVLLAASFSFFFHLCNGVRHLFWDAGFGFEIPRARATGMFAVGAALVLTAVLWFVALTSGGANS